jgi:hypothetical protein
LAAHIKPGPHFDARVAQLRAKMLYDPDPTYMHLFPPGPRDHVCVALECWCGPRTDELEPRLVIHRWEQ